MIATPRRTTPVTRTPERTAPESRGPSVSRRMRWALLAALGFVIVPLVYAAAVLTPIGQRVEDAALGGVRESDLFGSDTALNVISVPVILLLVVVIAAVGLARRRLAVGLGAGVVVLASAATSTLVKRIAERPEIAQSTTPNSFPSGHATIALAALFAVLLVTPRRFPPPGHAGRDGVRRVRRQPDRRVRVAPGERTSSGPARSRSSGSGSSVRSGRVSTGGSAATGTADGVPGAR